LHAEEKRDRIAISLNSPNGIRTKCFAGGKGVRGMEISTRVRTHKARRLTKAQRVNCEPLLRLSFDNHSSKSNVHVQI